MKITDEQKAAIESSGKTIVSASAGSGKTFVMIQKLVAAIESGTQLSSVLAVTFTKKAAAQMKEKLRAAIIDRMAESDAEMRKKLKVQLSEIPTANISTIHSLCAKLLRTYFYAVGIDGAFDIISSDDAAAKDYKNRAIDNLFERYYDEDNANFKALLRCYRKKRGDGYLKNLILESYEKLRINADYAKYFDEVNETYTDEGFEKVCKIIKERENFKLSQLKSQIAKFENGFECPRPEYEKILEEMNSALNIAEATPLFKPLPPLAVTRKPIDRTEEQKLSGEIFKNFKDGVSSRYKALRADICEEAEERERFFKSGEIAKAFLYVLKQFDEEYAAVKRYENKLDYNDLEHFTLRLLRNENIRAETASKFTHVFVDEYQDVNPVQENIIRLIGGGDVFLVGDVKQAIYGFRGSKSLFFAEKYSRFDGGDGKALRLSNNFRSSDKVIEFVNSLFSGIMTEDSCSFDYSRASMMLRGGGYPDGYGSAQIHVFGKEEKEDAPLEVYSVKSAENVVKYTREGLAVLEIVERELKSKHYDLKSGEYVDTQTGDICILTRKRNKNAAEIVRALTDAGYTVSGAKGSNILTRPEVRQMLDILSYIDNTNQDIPLTTALLSPLGGFDCDELAKIRIAAKGLKKLTFRECCALYASDNDNAIAQKLNAFYKKIEALRGYAEILSAAEIIDKIAEQSGREAYGRGGEGAKNLRRLAAEGEGISVCAFLAKIKDGYDISAPSSASSDSIKILTMHASKGLEFPVVIIADVCSTFKGREQSELPFNETFGFAPKYYDCEKRLAYPTLLRRLTADTDSAEELKNELNLFYVACTRAMCNLHVLAEEITPYTPLGAFDAVSYSKLFDISAYSPEIMEIGGGVLKDEKVTLVCAPDEELKSEIEKRFNKDYEFSESINLPIKSSASAILRLAEEDNVKISHSLFSGEGETDADKGTAYHRFLELCDFSVTDADGILKELDGFERRGCIPSAQRALLNVCDLSEILNMSVFERVRGEKNWREREFLCRMSANELYDCAADDAVLVQGAIDLLALTREGYLIIDYKYSSKTDGELVAKYSKQLELYKKAVARIMRVDEKSIGCVIVNIFKKRQINLK